MMDLSGKAITDTYPTRMLCGKRLDNGLPFAGRTDGLPHTCFEDVVMVPIASWAFYLALVGLVALLASRRGRSNGGEPKRALHRLIHRRDYAGGSSWTQRRPKTATGLSILYSLLVIATLLMNVLEVVRLYLADRGAGLLPFTLASIVIVLVLMHVPLPSHARLATGAVILFFWAISLALTSVQLATLTRLQDVEPRARTEYLDSDQIIDVAVIVGLYGLEVLVEAARLVSIKRSASKVSRNAYASEATVVGTPTKA